jgi:hypothetical protein
LDRLQFTLNPFPRPFAEALQYLGQFEGPDKCRRVAYRRFGAPSGVPVLFLQRPARLH